LEEHLMSTTLDSALVAELAGQVSGSVLGPQDAGYDAARAVHNGLIDRRPALIVRCRTTNDVIAALSFAHRAGLEVSIRGGGHNVAGRAVTDGGVMIDLAEMKAIAIDPDKAIATAEAASSGRAERRRRRARAGRDRRRRLHNGYRRPDARRRARPADGQVRARSG
jgi:FAD binding domain-containing protein